MDIISQYKQSLEQLRKTKEFLIEMNPIDFDLRSIIHTIDSKINKTEKMIHMFQGKGEEHRCGICDRAYDEEEPKAVMNIKVCPVCRNHSQKYQCASVWEKKYNLPKGTIKRDCVAKDGKPAKLQPFIDCGLVYKSGSTYIVHEMVIQMYYQNSDLYKTRKRRKKPSS